MKSVKVGLIGCGEIAAESTVPAIKVSGKLKVVATMDVNVSLAEDLAKKTGAGVYTDNVNELLACDQVEAVIISTPHYLHAPLGIKAARKKKHVLVEKPLAETTAKGKKLIAACKKHRVKLSVLYISRFREMARKAQALIRKGAIGRVTGFSLIHMVEKPNSYWSGGYTGRIKTDWRTKKATAGGGYLIMNLTHNIDLMHALLNLKPKTVFAQHDTFRSRVEVEDYISVIVRYQSGVIGTFMGSTICPGAMSQPDHIYGTHGTIVLDKHLKVFTRKTIAGLKRDRWTHIRLPKQAYRAELLTNFARAVCGEERLVVTGENALSSVRVIEAAYRSQEQGRLITLR